MHVRLYAVYSISILQRTDMDTTMIASDVASHAFRFPRKSNLTDVANNPFPNAVDNEEIVIRLQPIRQSKKKTEEKREEQEMFDGWVLFLFLFLSFLFICSLFKSFQLRQNNKIDEQIIEK